MTSPLLERAFAKINLTLRVIGRRADGYHELESLVVFADLADTLTLRPAAETTLAVTGPFAAASGKTEDNLVLKAVTALGLRISGLKSGHFMLDKQIPVAAGIGGGSADAAAALRLLASANGLALDDARLMTAALQIGADVPVCLESRACVMAGVGERLSPPLELPELPALLVNPGVAVMTRDVFAALDAPHAGTTRLGEIPRAMDALIDFLNSQGNDLTAAAITRAPIIGEVLNALQALPGVRLTRMSGSGATCFALFGSRSEAEAGAASLGKDRNGWWITPATFS